MIRVAALLVCLATVVVSQRPEPCDTPLAWEARASAYDHGAGQNNRFRISYDAVNKRRRILEEIDAFTPGREFYEYLELGNEHKIYIINQATRHCEVREDPYFRMYEIPKNATFEGAHTIGFGLDESFEVHEWSDRIAAGRLTWIGGFTARSCVPVSEVIFKTNITNSVTNHFYDITGGISDPNIFIVPTACSQL
ncbi:mammalian ependymin-related protein 1-like [Sycon ciliatum]|uniref:mammalian ependymin-related protein 1-like n=1 Tax=Sycon ciliatum TaxID=27933 RepID=UPI0020AE3933|eukprot:scpid92940/ scgid29396/ Mammalian ependymin-related protein 1